MYGVTPHCLYLDSLTLSNLGNVLQRNLKTDRGRESIFIWRHKFINFSTKHQPWWCLCGFDVCTGLPKKTLCHCHCYYREVSQNWNFFKNIWFLHHLKALNKRISEWAYFLNLTRWFQRYLNFSASKRVFLTVCYYKVMYEFQSESTLYSLPECQGTHCSEYYIWSLIENLHIWNGKNAVIDIGIVQIIVWNSLRNKYVECSKAFSPPQVENFLTIEKHFLHFVM